jgi:hypothetical protein
MGNLNGQVEWNRRVNPSFLILALQTFDQGFATRALHCMCRAFGCAIVVTSKAYARKIPIELAL